MNPQSFLAAVREHIEYCRECAIEGVIADDCEEGKKILGPWHLRLRASIRAGKRKG